MTVSPARVLLVLAMLAAAAVRADEQPGVVKVGAILSLSGVAAAIGDAQLKTLQLYVERTNAQGGVLTRKLVLQHFDDASDARTASDFARKLSERDHTSPDHADFVIGGSTSETSLAIATVLARSGVPFLALGSASRIIDPPRRWIFKTPPTERTEIRTILSDMKKRGYTRIGLLTEENEFGRECAKELRDQTGRNSLGRRTYGVSLESDQSFGGNDEELAQAIARVKGTAGMQALVVLGLGERPALATKRIRAEGIALPIYQAHGVVTEDFLRVAGKDAEGVLAAGPALAVVDQLPDADPQKAVIKAYVANYRERYGAAPSEFGAYAYDALMLAIAAIGRVDTLNYDEVRRSFDLTRNHVGVTGIYEESPGNVFSLGAKTLRMLHVKDGAWRLAD